MRYLILLIILIAPETLFSQEKSKVIFNLRGEQHLTVSGPGTEITKEAEIIWETAKDGEIPEGAVIGTLERAVVNGKPVLRESQELRARFDAKENAARDAALAKSDRQALIRSVDSASNITQMRAVLKALIVELEKD